MLFLILPSISNNTLGPTQQYPSSPLAAVASPLEEAPAVQIRRLQTENRRFRMENGSPGMEEDESYYSLRAENFPFQFDTASFLTEIEKRAEEEAEAPWWMKEAVNSTEEKKEGDGDEEAEENRRLKAQIAVLKEAQKVASIVQTHLEIENASLRKGEEAAEKAMRERDDMREALELAVAQCESLRLELDKKKGSDDADEKFAQLVEAGIARDRAVEKMEDCMAHNKFLEERLGRHERAVRAVRDRALRMLERVKKLADDDDNDAGEAMAAENEEMEVDEKWIGVLMRPLEEEMEKIESSFKQNDSSLLINCM